MRVRGSATFPKLCQYLWACLIAASVLRIIYVQTSVKNEAPSRETKYILYWTSEGKSRTFYFNDTETGLFSKCPVSNCFATVDRSLLPVEEYDAIMFYVPTLINRPNEVVPSKRSPHQRYIFGNFETPINFPANRSRYMFNNFYNWTMTYRFDSDLVRRHGFVTEYRKNKFQMPCLEFVRNKKRTAAWFVSNCYSVDKREELGKELQKYIDVDVYGQCGNFSCPKNQDCYAMAEKRYKFYLSFENSYCKDYTTEKLFQILSKNIVPVVYGGGNYIKVAPPHSYINVEDFDSVEKLADYLKMLANNPKKYLEYFKWKKDFKVVRNQAKVMCDLCEMLNNPNQPPKRYVDIKQWWSSTDNSGCKAGKMLPKIVRNLH